MSGDVSWSTGFTCPVSGGRRWTLLPLGPRKSLPRGLFCRPNCKPWGEIKSTNGSR